MELVRQALRISPRDSLRGLLLLQMARACLATREYADGVEWAELALGERATDPAFLRILALNLVGLGKIEGARAALQKVRSLSSEYLEAGLHGRLGYHKAEHFQRALIFLRVAADLENSSAAEAVR
jgi:tetratricopeptide (TPR) repeat protein